jgi:polar amino acid transport system substrate-binding protein
MNKILWVMGLITILLSPVCMAQKSLRICLDNKDWYPFIYQKEGEAQGIFVELTKAALQHNKISAVFIVAPMKRCINVLAKNGEVDAVIGLPFSHELQQHLYYPKDAMQQTSQWRLMQVDFNLVTAKNDDYDFNGVIVEIPQPIRIAKAYVNIIEQLKKQNIQIEISKQDDSSFYKLIRDNKGSLVTSSIMALHQDENPKFSNKFIVHPEPVSSQSFYLAFFKDTGQSNTIIREKIWQNIAFLRDDYVFMLQLLSEY